ncbi:uncharacterized protein LOC132589622 [Heteronotia binoei]|uniref:uncharacterized protein LOC132589622 n=1 Tax=Heteronotia binoei TaxID=13085 RepID=UPI002931220D|nr:uncharacterized protein LOC132589622 [Heteronotia binoei]
MRQPVPVEQRVAIAIWWLANTTNYRLMGNQFRLARLTVAGIVQEVTQAIEEDLINRAVYLGSHDRIMQAFVTMGFPNCVGAVDGCHILIHAPPRLSDNYINRKRFYSILLQGTVDHTGCFTDVVIGYSGKCHDAYFLWCSNLIDLMDSGDWVPGNPMVTIQNVQVPPLILADAAYPLRCWLMMPYTGHLTPEQARYNAAHNKCRNVVELAFGRLKARWRCLNSEIPVDISNVNAIVASCVILHNLCDVRGHDAVMLPEDTPPVVVQDDDEGVDDHVDERQLEMGRALLAVLKTVRLDSSWQRNFLCSMAEMGVMRDDGKATIFDW